MFFLGSPEPLTLTVHNNGKQTVITMAANCFCFFYLSSLCWHRLVDTEWACNRPFPPLWPHGSVRSYKKLSFFKLCFHWRQMQGQPCSEDGEGHSESQSCWRVRRTKRIKDRTFFNSRNNVEESIRGFQVCRRQFNSISYCLLWLVSPQNICD